MSSTVQSDFPDTAPGGGPARPATQEEETAQRRIRNRIRMYWVTAAVLLAGGIVLRTVSWTGSTTLHTVMETAATVLAALVGTLALVHYYSRRSNLFLFVGAGFVGTAFLDCYHTVVTAAVFTQWFPSPPASLVPWSWVASRLFLSVMLALSWITWRRQDAAARADAYSPRIVYATAGLLTLACFVLFAFVPLPPAYYPDLIMHRPEELVPGVLFAAALAGHLRLGAWRHGDFEHWLVLCLIVNLASQAAFMSFSGSLFDTMFDAAHLLKKVSYLAALTGLLVSIHALFRESERHARSNLEAVLRETRDGIMVLSESSSEITTGLEQVSSAVAQTASAVNETSTTAAQLGSTAAGVMADAQRVAELAARAATAADDGSQAVEQTISGIRRARVGVQSLAESVLAQSEQGETVASVMATIDDIAARTRVLAVNAAMEAAKAGAEGDGFAVVAHEMRRLAQQGQQATVQVREILTASHRAATESLRAGEEGANTVEAAMASATRAGETIGDLAAAVRAAAKAMDQSVAASREQVAGVDQIVGSMQALGRAADDNAHSLRRIERASGELDALGRNLAALARRYQG